MLGNSRFKGKMEIGTVQLGKHPLLLAPMEDVTDIGFRLLCRRLGASMVYSEFVAADALVRMIDRSLDKLTICEAERPIAIQIYGKDAIAVRDAAQIVEERVKPNVLDLNFGCPVKRVAGKGAGAGLLQNIPQMLEITQKVVEAVHIPVTAKTRLGWDENHKIIVSLAEQLQDCGISALTIHGRTRSQMYNGVADWKLIGEVKQNPHILIPIIGNGDISSASDALNAFSKYAVDAVMIGRATFGRPWIFKEIYDAIHDKPLNVDNIIRSDYKPMSADWKLDVLKEQVRQSVERIDMYRGILHIRRHLAASPLFKGLPNFRNTRIEMLRANSVEVLFEIIESTRPLLREAETIKMNESPILS